MLVFPQDGFEELARSREDDLVCSHGVLLTGESHVEEVLVSSELSKLLAEVGVIIFPSETKLLILHPGAELIAQF